MQRTAYQLWDVFTDRPFSGNQLAVVPDADGLPDLAMQKIANEFALSETVFIASPTHPDCQARLRIFTPQRELPMAGHPTIGAAFALAASGRLGSRPGSVSLQLEVGPTRVDLDWDGDDLNTAWMTQRAPEFGPSCTDLPGLARMLRIPPSDLAGSFPGGQILSSGVPFLFVALASRRAVDAAVLDRPELVRLCQGMGIEECPIYLFSLEPGDDDASLYSRMFAPVFGIDEDPATGGANGPLGAYVAKLRPDRIPGNRTLINLQGAKMGRPSRLFISVPAPNAESQAFRVGGTSMPIGQGELRLE